eukprot:TRINITY_DN151_c0_g1_i2.p1 TRINITY_DN151_c0_g1~~TRINITY_DN151_c0_g1_i2.p1  ORF type:complete len:722 (-),score=193.89 TRINITY_DN151_c0_g1_i2:124-2289(-)
MEVEYITNVQCMACGSEVERTEGNLPAIIDAIVVAQAATRKEEAANWQWELKLEPCEHTLTLQQVENGPMLMGDGALKKCGLCDLNSNLWLCMSCGFLGCGRRQYDGSGGNGHAVDHARTHEHWVACKTGTITPEGNADIHCYSCEEERRDPELALHLQHFGIDVRDQVKTERSMAEMELEQNLSFSVNSNVDEGQVMTPLYGPGMCGLVNLGNSCYMSSIMQVLFHHPVFAQRYGMILDDHEQSCEKHARHALCFECQMAKVARAIAVGQEEPSEAQKEAAKAKCADENAKDDFAYQVGIAPRMFKNLICKGHPLFAGTQQQDAMDFLDHFIKEIHKHEHGLAGGELDPTRAFNFTMEERIQCLSCHQVRYLTTKGNNNIIVRVPLDAAINDPMQVEEKPAAEKPAEAVADEKVVAGDKPAAAPKKPVPTVPFDACIGSWAAAETLSGWNCPNCQRTVAAMKQQRFRTFPDTLIVATQRYSYEKLMPVKIEVNVDVPLTLDLGSLSGRGLQPGETELPAPQAGGAADQGPAVDDEAVQAIVGMGFPQVHAENAVIATGNNGVEAAMGWLMEHMGDADIDVPKRQQKKAAGGVAEAPAEAVESICSLGFNPSQARRGLKETNNDLERAVDWLFNHPDADEEAAVTVPESAAPTIVEPDLAPAKYKLIAAVNHRGASAQSGHYVAHLLIDDKWVLFNDRRVFVTPHPALGSAYIYFYRREEE